MYIYNTIITKIGLNPLLPRIIEKNHPGVPRIIELLKKKNRKKFIFLLVNGKNINFEQYLTVIIGLICCMQKKGNKHFHK